MRRRLPGWFGRGGDERLERDVEDEIAFHHAMRERELMAEGLSRAEAERVARESFGDEAMIRAEVYRIDTEIRRRRRLGEMVDSIAQDVRYGLRGLWRDPLLTLIAVATLAIGMGGNGVVFSLVEAVLLRAPQVESPDRLASIWTTCRRGDPRCSSSYPDFEDYRDRSTRFSDIAAYSRLTVSANTGSGADVVGAELVSDNYFELLGVEPAAGRLFAPGGGGPAVDAGVVVLSNGWWRSRFAGDAGVIGSTLRVNDVPFVVIGVAPAGFAGLVLGQEPDFWLPLRSLPLVTEEGADRLASRGSRWIQGLVGRLAPGATLTAARSEMLAISDRLAAEDPDARGPRSVTVEALGGRVGGSDETLSSFLAILQGVVVVTLLLACANLANLLVARSAARQSETGVRLALGVGRVRIVRQHLVESLLLAGAGGLAALALVSLLLRGLGAVTLPRGLAIDATGATLNLPVLAFVGALTLGATLLFGMLPAAFASRAPLMDVLRRQRTGASRSVARLRSALIGIQVGLGVVLLVGAALFIRTLQNRLNVDIGFDPGGLALVTVDPSLGGIPPERARQLPERLTERLSGLPGVQSAAAGRTVPVRPGGNGTFVEVDGYQPAPDEEMRVEFSMVTPGYLRTLGLSITAGSDLTGAAATDNSAIVIDETMASRWWPDRDPIGGTVRIGESAFRVVGIARRTAWGGLDVGTTPFIFIPAGSDRGITGPFTLVVRTSGDAAALLPSLRSAVREVEPGLAIRQLSTMQSEIDTLLGPQRTAAWLLSAFSALALALAIIGIWGVVSYSVTRRRRDLSVRLALGATGRQIVRLVVGSTLVPIGAGLVGGIIAARALSGTVTGFMFGITGSEPATYLVVGAILSIVAGLAAWLPARNAARTDPVQAMRAE